jgi:hypothetical protein
MSSPLYDDPGYRAARRWWASMVELGGVCCNLCGQPIVGPFDLDHVRAGGGLAATHPRCNRSEGARHGHTLAARRRLQRGGALLAR